MYELDVDNARVAVWEVENGRWSWSFAYRDGSSRVGDTDWETSEREAKEWAKARYSTRTGVNLKRAKWLKIKESKDNG